MIYNTTNGITTLKKHVNSNHYTIAKLFEGKINIPLKGGIRRQPTKKISIFLLPKNLSNAIICKRNCFLKIWTCLLLKIIYPCNLLKVYG
jgi:hypothetical protein